MVLDARGRTEGEAVWSGTYEAGDIEIIERCLPPGGRLLDVGANVGLIAVPVARAIAGSGGRVVAIEPVPENAERISRSADLNGLSVEVIQVALGDRDGRARMVRESGLGASTGNAVLEQVAAAIRTGVARDVEMVTLDSLADRIGPVDVVKLDVEGAEILVLQGGLEYLRATRPVVLGEFGRGLLGGFGHTFLDVVPICEALRYRIVGFDDGGRPLVLQPRPGLRDVLLVPDERLPDILEALH